ncbi:hypothetical protein Hanom_Chr03g00221901 [Helianthus anomalus]
MEKVALYQSAFPTFGGSMGVKPLGDGEVFWFEKIKPNFMYAPPKLFATLPVTTQGARIPNPRPLHGATSAWKEIVNLSSEESVGSSNHKLSSWADVFAGVLRDLGIDLEEKKTKKVATKKKTAIAGGVTGKKGKSTRAASETAAKKGTLRFHQSNLEDYVVVD